MKVLVTLVLLLCILMMLIGLFTEEYFLCSLGAILVFFLIIVTVLTTNEEINCDCCSNGCVSTINTNKCKHCNHSIDKHSNCTDYGNCKEEKEFDVIINCKCHECKADDLDEQNAHLCNHNHENNTEEIMEEMTSKGRYCSSCGTMFDEKDNFCSSCGKKRVSN